MILRHGHSNDHDYSMSLSITIELMGMIAEINDADNERSGGQKSRLAFAIITWREPHLLILVPIFVIVIIIVCLSSAT